MSLEDFQLLDNEAIANSIINRVFTKIDHRQGDKVNQSNQNIKFIFGEINIYRPIGNSCLQFNITVRKNDGTDFHYDDPIRLVNNAIAFCFKEARLCTTIGADIVHIKVGEPVSNIMSVISIKEAELSSQFDNVNEKDIPILERLADLPPQVRDTPHQKMLINNHTDVNKSKRKGCLYLEYIFGFCRSF